MFWNNWLARMASWITTGDHLRSATLQASLQRLRSLVKYSSLIAIGSGRGNDVLLFQRFWPGSYALLIDLDVRFQQVWEQLNRKDPNIRGVVCAAGADDGNGYFRKGNDVGGYLDSEGKAADVQATPIKKIDTLIREFNMPGPYFLKFDTHGVELDVLAGCTETLKNTALIMIEVYNFKLKFVSGKNLTFDEMSLHMKSLGFRCIGICDPLYRPGDNVLWQFHMFFVRDDHPVWKRSGFS